MVRYLLAVVSVYEDGGRVTVRDVAAAADRSVASTYVALTRLAAAGFVVWEPGRNATLRPLVYRP